MNKFFKASGLAVLACCLSLGSVAMAQNTSQSAVNVTLMSNKLVNNGRLPINKITNLVVKHVVRPQRLLSAQEHVATPTRYQVQPIYKKGKVDHLLVFIPSNVTYSFTVQRMNVSPSFAYKSIKQPYKLTAEDWAQQPTLKTPVCPNPDVNFVVGSNCYSMYPTVAPSIDGVATAATDAGYTVAKLLDADATVASYEGYLTCPNLKGFFNIGHGYNEGILLEDGIMSYTFFQGLKNTPLQERPVVEFNSCEVFNDPLKSAVIDDADVRQYAGGISTLLIGTSEPASECFWEHIIAQKPIDDSLNSCAQQDDPQDVWGVGGHGSETMAQP